jgi:Cu/Ag efflux protein CusF
MKALFLIALLVLVAVLTLGCQPAAEQAQQKEYEISGKVIAVDADKKTVTLDHEDIPGLMAAMEMDFKVEDPSAVKGVTVGDQVQGKLQVKSGEYIITHLEKQ